MDVILLDILQAVLLIDVKVEVIFFQVGLSVLLAHTLSWFCLHSNEMYIELIHSTFVVHCLNINIDPVLGLVSLIWLRISFS